MMTKSIIQIQYSQILDRPSKKYLVSREGFLVLTSFEFQQKYKICLHQYDTYIVCI